jgi:hypothetical protein
MSFHSGRERSKSGCFASSKWPPFGRSKRNTRRAERALNTVSFSLLLIVWETLDFPLDLNRLLFVTSKVLFAVRIMSNPRSGNGHFLTSGILSQDIFGKHYLISVLPKWLIFTDICNSFWRLLSWLFVKRANLLLVIHIARPKELQRSNIVRRMVFFPLLTYSTIMFQMITLIEFWKFNSIFGFISTPSKRYDPQGLWLLLMIYRS